VGTRRARPGVLSLLCSECRLASHVVAGEAGIVAGRQRLPADAQSKRVVRRPWACGTKPSPPLITCATLAAADIGKLVTLAQDAGWQPCVIVTPKALNFIDHQALEAQTGYPVRSDYKHPSDPDALPKADGIICAGASFNTIGVVSVERHADGVE
jgi:hypothetical protein